MPSKPRRKGGSQSFQGKKRKNKRPPVLTATQTYNPTAPYPVTAPSVSMPTPTSTPTAAKYPSVVNELKRIGIIAGIMLAVLIILSRVLP